MASDVVGATEVAPSRVIGAAAGQCLPGGLASVLFCLEAESEIRHLGHEHLSPMPCRTTWKELTDRYSIIALVMVL